MSATTTLTRCAGGCGAPVPKLRGLRGCGRAGGRAPTMKLDLTATATLALTLSATATVTAEVTLR